MSVVRDLRAGAYVGAAIFRDDRLLLLRRVVGDGYGSGRWELPGGSVEPGESMERALRREVREETGFTIRIVRPFSASIFRARSSRGRPVAVVAVRYVCRAPAVGRPRLAVDEHDAYRWVGPGEYPRAPTVVGTARAVREAFGAR